MPKPQLMRSPEINQAEADSKRKNVHMRIRDTRGVYTHSSLGSEYARGTK